LATAAKIQVEMAAPLPKQTKQTTIASGIIRTPSKVIIDENTGEISFDNWGGDGTVIDRSAADWDVENARPSTKEHAHIFADGAVNQVLSWAFFGDKEPTSGTLKIS
jgi:hypothetical protein